ncbi:hypothetical protein I6A60_16790 [Frankia sp. AgB1.9]|uniref:hypothetical protein n=1 Tax=unclassified Frankia TaxID=2632575 RepID=UPI0019323A9A|nr:MULTISPECIES: hypothetical protein [unclassified Frankia]MBL7487551.1 hypothetical protein [Frankia sp. AgW1.1]MBL7549522.1 hypothetical protein [Frankia sp. AgB1.9]MBL7620689.1 hypothetical protein [Frankia sp. AgB1.8]
MIRVKAAFFSATGPAPEGDDGSYLRWHLLDHMPEQYQLPGLVYATRWTTDSAYLGARIAGTGPLADVANVVNYLVGDPVQQTHDDFLELGVRLAEAGRFPIRRPSLQLRLLALLRWYAAPRALVAAEVVPFRPHRGIALIIEEPASDDVSDWLRWLHTQHYPELLQVPAVAGAWQYGSTDFWRLNPAADGPPQFVTVVYLDDDPLTTVKLLAPIIEQRWASGAVRPLFAGPLKSMIQWDAWTS